MILDEISIPDTFALPWEMIVFTENNVYPSEPYGQRNAIGGNFHILCNEHGRENQWLWVNTEWCHKFKCILSLCRQTEFQWY